MFSSRDKSDSSDSYKITNPSVTVKHCFIFLQRTLQVIVMKSTFSEESFIERVDFTPENYRPVSNLDGKWKNYRFQLDDRDKS